MDKIWRVAWYEFGRNVFKKSFLIALASVPLFIVVSIGFGLILESQEKSVQSVGLVDLAGVIPSGTIPDVVLRSWEEKLSAPVDFTFYQSGEAGRAALEAGVIQAYFILPESYPSLRQVEAVYTVEPGDQAWMQLHDLLRASLASGQPPQVVERVVSGVNVVISSLDGKRQLPVNSGPTFGLLMPLFIAAAVLTMLVMGSGYTSGAVADEKENRTVEVLVTSISPMQLIGGKIVGTMAISLALMTAWAGVVSLGVFVARQAGIAWFNDLSVDWRTVAATFVVGIPAFMLAMTLMTAIGMIVTTTQESQSLSGLFFILHFLPLYLNFALIQNPHGTLAVLMSFLPFTSLMTVAMRNLISVVPAWQVALSALLHILYILGAIWLASRAFRVGMLQYGQRLSLRHLLARG